MCYGKYKIVSHQTASLAPVAGEEACPPAAGADGVPVPAAPLLSVKCGRGWYSDCGSDLGSDLMMQMAANCPMATAKPTYPVISIHSWPTVPPSTALREPTKNQDVPRPNLTFKNP